MKEPPIYRSKLSGSTGTSYTYTIYKLSPLGKYSYSYTIVQLTNELGFFGRSSIDRPEFEQSNCWYQHMRVNMSSPRHKVDQIVIGLDHQRASCGHKPATVSRAVDPYLMKSIKPGQSPSKPGSACILAREYEKARSLFKDYQLNYRDIKSTGPYYRTDIFNLAINMQGQVWRRTISDT